jgi:hypothetical protein
MTHEQCRRNVIDGRLAAAQPHLRGCAACRRFAEANATVLRLVPQLVPAASADLADRVLARVGAVEAGPPPVRRLDGARHSRARTAAERRWLRPRPPVLPVVAASIALLLALGGLVIGTTPGRSPEDVLLVAARQTVAEGSAEVDIEARAEVVLPVPEGDGLAAPDLAAAPEELHAQVEAEWARVLADFDRAMAEFELELQAFQAALDRTVEERQRQIDEQLRELERSFGQPGDRWGGPGAPPPPPPAPRDRPVAPPRPQAPGAPERPAPHPPSLPESVRAGFTARAHGTIGFADLELGLRGAVDGRVRDADFELAVRGGQALLLQPDGTWVSLPGPFGPLGSVLLDPGAIERVLTSPAGPVEAAGTATVEGERLERYRFRVDAQALGEAAEGQVDAEAWIDRDGRLRHLTLDTDRIEAGARWRTHVGLRLSGFASPVPRPELPAPSTALPIPERPAQLTYPLGPAVRAADEG